MKMCFCYSEQESISKHLWINYYMWVPIYVCTCVPEKLGQPPTATLTSMLVFVSVISVQCMHTHAQINRYTPVITYLCVYFYMLPYVSITERYKNTLTFAHTWIYYCSCLFIWFCSFLFNVHTHKHTKTSTHT